MHKVAFIGDPHVKISNLEDSKNLINFIEKTCKTKEVDTIIFMGDLFDTHDVVRIRITKFWHDSLKKLAKNFKVISLIGNHDMVMTNETTSEDNALYSFNIKNLTIVDKGVIIDGVAFCPYIHHHDKLLEVANGLDAKTLIAHQTFTGAQYDNGFYAKDGIDPALLRHEKIISGHIHTLQTIGKCFYVGTAKWDSANDANEDKGFHTAILNDGGFTDFEFISTKGVVTSIERIVINEGDNVELGNSPKTKYLVELVGSNAWITKTKKGLKGKAQIKAKPTDRAFKVEKNSEDFKATDYIESFKFIDGITKADITNYLRELGCQM